MKMKNEFFRDIRRMQFFSLCPYLMIFPGVILFVVILLCIAILAGAGVSYLIQNQPQDFAVNWTRIAFLGSFALLALVLLCFLLFLLRWSGRNVPDRTMAYSFSLGRPLTFQETLQRLDDWPGARRLLREDDCAVYLLSYGRERFRLMLASLDVFEKKNWDTLRCHANHQANKKLKENEGDVENSNEREMRINLLFASSGQEEAQAYMSKKADAMITIRRLHAAVTEDQLFIPPISTNKYQPYGRKYRLSVKLLLNLLCDA